MQCRITIRFLSIFYKTRVTYLRSRVINCKICKSQSKKKNKKNVLNYRNLDFKKLTKKLNTPQIRYNLKKKITLYLNIIISKTLHFFLLIVRIKIIYR